LILESAVNNMNILVIDAQGGKIGGKIVSAVKEAFPNASLTAVGTNGLATSAMLKAGADQGATGENAVVVGCRTADIIAGPIGIVIADAMLGEITPAMALAVGRSRARKFFIPINHCNNFVVGVTAQSLSRQVQELVAQIGVCVKREDEHDAR